MTLEAPKGSREFMDAPNATPSDEQYEDAHSRYGTDRFTDVDAKVIATWRQQNPDWDKSDEEKKVDSDPNSEDDGDQNNNSVTGTFEMDPAGNEGGATSPGTSSQRSSGKTERPKKLR